MRSQEQDLDARTVSAMLASVEAAAEVATSLPEPERTKIVARITEQAELLEQLKQFTRHAQHAEALQAASGRAFRAAQRAGAGPMSPTPQPPGPLHEPTRNSTATPHGTLTPTAHAVPDACLPPRPTRPRLLLPPAQAMWHRAIPADSRRHLRRGPQPRLGGIPRRRRLRALDRLRPPLGLAPAATSPGSRTRCDFARSRTRCDFARSRPGCQLRPVPDPLHRTRDQVRPLSTRPDRAANRDPSAQYAAQSRRQRQPPAVLCRAFEAQHHSQPRSPMVLSRGHDRENSVAPDTASTEYHRQSRAGNRRLLSGRN